MGWQPDEIYGLASRRKQCGRHGYGNVATRYRKPHGMVMSVVGLWATAAQARQLGFDWIKHNDEQEAAQAAPRPSLFSTAGHAVGPVARPFQHYMHSAGPDMMMMTFFLALNSEFAEHWIKSSSTYDDNDVFFYRNSKTESVPDGLARQKCRPIRI